MAMKNCREKQLIRRNNLFWLTVSEVLVHGYYPLSPSGSLERNLVWWEANAVENAHFKVNKKGKERGEESSSLNILSNVQPQ